MTTHYVDIRLLPDPDFSRVHLLAALYSKLHRALVHLRTDDIGVSFPGYQVSPRSLGDTMRLHGTEAALQKLLATDWLTGMRDHISVAPIRNVPASAIHRTLRRRQFRTNVDRLRRRRMRRHGETVEEARNAIPDNVEQDTNLPYIRMRSHSTGHVFHMFFCLGDPTSAPHAGVFNTYGLSSTATIPWF